MVKNLVHHVQDAVDLWRDSNVNETVAFWIRFVNIYGNLLAEETKIPERNAIPLTALE